MDTAFIYINTRPAPRIQLCRPTYAPASHRDIALLLLLLLFSVYRIRSFVADGKVSATLLKQLVVVSSPKNARHARPGSKEAAATTERDEKNNAIPVTIPSLARRRSLLRAVPAARVHVRSRILRVYNIIIHRIPRCIYKYVYIYVRIAVRIS